MSEDDTFEFLGHLSHPDEPPAPDAVTLEIEYLRGKVDGQQEYRDAVKELVEALKLAKEAMHPLHKYHTEINAVLAKHSKPGER
jgi:hypothetical protein